MTTVYPSSDGYFQQDNAPCHKARIISDWFLEHDNEFTVLKWPPQSPDLNPIEHLWDVVEREIRIMDVQPTNLQQLRDAIMSIWTKLTEECFQYLVESVPRRIKAVLKAKGGPTRLAKLGDLELLLHGLKLGYLSDILTENDVTWSSLMTMEREDLEKVGITEPEDQRKVLQAVQEMELDRVDMDTFKQLHNVDGSHPSPPMSLPPALPLAEFSVEMRWGPNGLSGAVMICKVSGDGGLTAGSKHRKPMNPPLVRSVWALACNWAARCADYALSGPRFIHWICGPVH
ncbi:Transposable element Tcb2 transposase [Merluccius polli]|uniref:Transposable element Tcb2 transposase n=1 Tax=Merluccius polli TaxID=89951 RepID=A0AA47MT44_MERPO|nr:Transposable element Tcb2 transposase [Merluccius polli]